MKAKTILLRSIFHIFVLGTPMAVALAAPVDAERALQDILKSEVMQDTPVQKRIRRLASADRSSEITLAWTAVKEKQNCFYVFNIPSGGSVFVSADDRLPAILGFTETGRFVADSIPDNMRWWLNEYTEQVATYLAADPAGNPYRRYSVSTDDYAPISPMISTRWNQMEPYNNLCPVDMRTGRRSVTGCVATAMAQIMKYHEWPVHPKGKNDGYTFDNTTLDWANMRDVYQDYQWTSKQAEAVALLMRQCGAAVNMMYSSYASGAYSYDVTNALATYFDYNSEMEILYREYYSQRQWNKLIYDELAAGRPVYYSGQSNAGGHAFVCDGYLGNEFYHFNWGWGGYEDGYFRLSALNPGTGGVGSSGGGYNAGQSIITGWKKSQGETKKQQGLVATGNFTYLEGNSYGITDGGAYNIIYNPLAYPQTFSFGIKVVEFDNSDATPVYAKASGRQTLSSMYGYPEIEVALPMLKSGKYKIYPAMYNCYEEWQDIPVPYGMQSYVTLTVEGTKKTFSNDGAPEETISDIIPSMPEFVSPIYEGDALSFRMTVSNVGKGDYYNNIILGLYNDSPFGSIAEIDSKASVPGNQSVDVDFHASRTLEAGDYTMYFMNSEFEDFISPVRLKVLKASDRPTPSSKLVITEITPAFIEGDKEVGLSVTAVNSTENSIKSDIRIKLLKASDLSEVDGFGASEPYTFPANESVILNFTPHKYNVVPGNYYWLCVDANDKPLSRLQPLKVYGAPVEEGIVTYQVTDELSKRARIVAVADTEENVSIPYYAGGYKVTAIKPDVFTFNKKVAQITLPGGIGEIPSGEFYCAEALEYLNMTSIGIPVRHERAFAPDVEQKITISGPDGGYTNLYHLSTYWCDFNMSSWNIFWPTEAMELSGLLRDGDGNIYNPYYVGASEKLRFKFVLPGEEILIGQYTTPDGDFTSQFKTSVNLPALNGGSGEVHFEIRDNSGIKEIFESDSRADVFAPDGRRVLKDATEYQLRTLPRGIYIVKGKKIII